jgi:hypothetical protein
VELQVRARARGIRRYHVKYVVGRGTGVQVHGAGDGVYADAECAGIFGLVGGECGDGDVGVIFGEEEDGEWFSKLKRVVNEFLTYQSCAQNDRSS